MADASAPAWIALVISTGSLLVSTVNARVQTTVSRRKVRLDLFDRRYALWKKIEGAVYAVRVIGGTEDWQDEKQLQTALQPHWDILNVFDEVEFLFGGDIRACYESLYSSLIQVSYRSFAIVRNGGELPEDYNVGYDDLRYPDGFVDRKRNELRTALLPFLSFALDRASTEPSTLQNIFGLIRRE